MTAPYALYEIRCYTCGASWVQHIDGFDMAGDYASQHTNEHPDHAMEYRTETAPPSRWHAL